jgi:glycosyltransferase involved in cell wall biosynthesis
MKRILLLIKGLGRGGAEQLLLSAVRYGDRTRFSYEVAYLLPWKDALVESLQMHGVSVHCLEGGHGVGWVSRLRSLVENHSVDLVHAHSPQAACGARIGLSRKLPLVYTEHNLWQRYRRPTYWANALTYPRNDHVFTVADEVRKSVIYPAPLRFRRLPPVETLYYGLDPAAPGVPDSSEAVRRELGIPAGAPIVGTIANFKPHKALDNLLEAAVQVRAEIPEVRFVLVGGGPVEKQIRERARELALDGTAVFTGYREDAARLATAFDLYALSSIHEGLSIALIEAMRLGKPAVVTKVGGLPEVVEHGKEGLVLRPGDTHGLSQAIITLLRDPELRRRLGGAARLRASFFDIRKSVRRTEEVYEQLLL